MAYGPYGGPPPRYPPGPRHGAPQGPAFGGGYGAPAQWRPARRKSHSGLVWVLAGLGVFAFVGVGLILVLAAANGPDDAGGTPVAQGSSTPTAPYSTAPTNPSPSDTYSDESPSSEPSPTETETRNTGRTNNTVYTAGALPITSCRNHPENPHSAVAIRTHLHHLFGCLDKAWGPELSKVGIAHSSPHSVITAGSGHGPCGDYPTPGSGVPYYCPSNNTIYASTTAVVGEYGRTPGYGPQALDSLFAHEYGHHVQNLTGIMDSYSMAAGSADDAKQLGYSRRLELQASCFEGMFMRSVQGSYPISPALENKLWLFNSNVGDWGRGPRNHGTPAHNGMWYRQGFDQKKALVCNTWTAPGSQTS